MSPTWANGWCVCMCLSDYLFKIVLIGVTQELGSLAFCCVSRYGWESHSSWVFLLNYFVLSQDDAFTESHMTTIGVDFVSLRVCTRQWIPELWVWVEYHSFYALAYIRFVQLAFPWNLIVFFDAAFPDNQSGGQDCKTSDCEQQNFPDDWVADNMIIFHLCAVGHCGAGTVPNNHKCILSRRRWHCNGVWCDWWGMTITRQKKKRSFIYVTLFVENLHSC